MFYFWGEPSLSGFEVSTEAHVNRFMEYVPVGITDLSIKDDTVAFLTQDGQVTVVYYYGQRFKLDFKKKYVASLSSGKHRVVLVTDVGTVYEWKLIDKSNMPRACDCLFRKQIAQVACGNDHSLVLTKDGELFTWGDNSSGQLGVGTEESSSSSPKLLKSLCGVPLAQISAGGDHSFALSLSGAAFGWGKNSSGQLGLGDREDRKIPTCLKCLNQKKTMFISCGEQHTAILTKGGVMFTFGSGSYGKLGHNSLRDELRPRLLGGLWGLSVSQIACGRHHTLALVGEKIYSFGHREQNQLGNGQNTDLFEPQVLHMLPEWNPEQTIEQIIAGGNLSVACYSTQRGETLSGSPNMRALKGTLVLNDEIMDRWILECDSKTVKREIQRMFSSASCINGSFIDKSNDKHYETSEGNSGLDLSLAHLAFKKLAQKGKIISEVKYVVKNRLIPSLDNTVAGVEAVRIYLIVPELIKVLNNDEQLTEALTSAILKLDKESLDLLENYWLELPVNYFKNMVDLFRDASAKALSHKIDHAQEESSPSRGETLWKSLRVLQTLYKVSCRKQHEISASDFIIHEINYLFELMHTIEEDLYNQLPFSYTETYINLLAVKEHHMHTLNCLALAPCTFNLEAKCSFLKTRRTSNCFRLVLRRQELVEDCFSQLKGANEHALRGWLQVMYSEKFEQTDVNKKDFFDKVFQALRSPTSGMFMYNDTKTLIWFPAEPSLDEERYFLFGILCGLVFYNNSIAYLPFPLALFKKLLDIEPSLEDLTELSPVGKRLQCILDYSDDIVDNMDMSYRIAWDNKIVELDPNEPDKCVTSANKKEFVDAYVDYVLNKSVERLFKEFKRGFYKVCQPDIVKFFQPEELRGVMVGTEEYDWNALKENATYEELFYASHSTIVSFWKVFDELSEDDKKRFLLFLTGFDRVPILGMNQVKMRVRPLYNATQDHLPQALTCHAILYLPMYQTKQTLKAKLIEALHHRRGFWED